MTQTKMRLAHAALLAAALVAIPAIAAAADDGPMTTVRAFLDAFNRGDIAAAQATNAADESIIDEIPPHEWHGPGAFQAWAADLGKVSAAAGQTEQKVALGRTVRDEINGDNGYVVVEVVFTYLEHGKPIVEHARIASALAKQAGAWKITGWAWAGDPPQPAQP